MSAAGAEAVALDDGSDPVTSCIAAHYGSLSRLTTPEIARTRLTEVLDIAPDETLANLMNAFLVVADLAHGPSDEIGDRLKLLHRAAYDDGYDRYILHWAGWLYGLARLDSYEAQLWMTRQTAFLSRTGIFETWLWSLSAVLTEAVDGRDVREPARRALALADREGYCAEADCALALAYSEACQGDPLAAAELLGTAVNSRFNATAHYVLYRVVVEPVVRQQLGGQEFTDAFARGQQHSAVDALATIGVR
jgi:hypothetical protein